MKIIVIGATGTIGRAVVKAVSSRDHAVIVGHRWGEYQVDLASPASIKKLYRAVGSFDAVVCAAGLAKFGALKELTDEDFHLGLSNKFMGQVNLVRLGLPVIAERGSFTLTSGVLSMEPMAGSAAISPVNAAIEGFVRAAALELPKGVRVNVVSPPWVKETLEAMGRDSSAGVPAAVVAKAYVASVEGTMSGAVIDARTSVAR
ncbi:MAG: short chain dehydrogenase [Nitrospirae bacterium]|nr:short chain dehydrogenase [Nitrospirota bacterium]